MQKPNLQEIFQSFRSHQDHRLLNPLFIALCNPLERVRWNAICCFGWLVPSIADKDPEAARIVMRRFLWSLNDESGGIGWGIPESMAEIMCHSSLLRREYLHMLISYMRKDGEGLFQDGNYLELPLLQRGLLWGIGRLCQEHRDEMINQKIVGDVAAYLESSDIYVIGLAIWCLGMLGAKEIVENHPGSRKIEGQLRLFVNQEFEEISIAELTRRAVSSDTE